MKWAWVFCFGVFLSIGSAQAFTCADVRALSTEQQAYYVKLFNITAVQQARIRAACYGRKPRHMILTSQ